MLKLFVVKLLLLTLVLFNEKSECLKCFVCRSDTDEGCPENSTFAKECPEKENRPVYCRKISQKLKFKNEHSWTTIRECAYEKGLLACYQFKWLDIAYQETCECPEERYGTKRREGCENCSNTSRGVICRQQKICVINRCNGACGPSKNCKK